MDGPAGWIISTGISGAMVNIAIHWALNGYDVPLDDPTSEMTDIFFAAGKNLSNA